MFGLPVGGIGLLIVLLRLGLFHFSQGPSATLQAFQQGGVAPARWTPAPTAAPETPPAAVRMV